MRYQSKNSSLYVMQEVCIHFEVQVVVALIKAAALDTLASNTTASHAAALHDKVDEVQKAKASKAECLPQAFN